MKDIEKDKAYTDKGYLKNSQKFESHSAGAIAESKLSKGLIYYGTDRGVFWYTKDDGKKWHENSENISNGYIRSIFPSQFEESRVYMAMTGINYDDLNNYLYVSENYGKNWQKIKGNLPNEPANVIHIAKKKFQNRIGLREFNFFNACISIAKTRN